MIPDVMQSARNVVVTLVTLVLASGGLTLSIVGTVISLLGVRPPRIEYKPLRPRVHRSSSSGDSIPDLISDNAVHDDSTSESSSIVTVSSVQSEPSPEETLPVEDLIVVPVEELPISPQQAATPISPSFTRFKGLARCIHGERVEGMRRSRSFLKRSSTLSSVDSTEKLATISISEKKTEKKEGKRKKDCSNTKDTGPNRQRTQPYGAPFFLPTPDKFYRKKFRNATLQT
ncbi:hypothetical protein V5O48_000966 [Marasmius crinis-equi]|uniref:Uncharacterized protein n=1 Tax=Marasmius crinis-equi TaxID=585013 RepID=A0ABR3FZX2_9AGAR